MAQWESQGPSLCVDSTISRPTPNEMERSSRVEDLANALSVSASHLGGLARRIELVVDAFESRLDRTNECLASIVDRVCALTAAAEAQRTACEPQMAAVVDQLGTLSASHVRASKQQRALLATLVVAESEEEARAPSPRATRLATPPAWRCRRVAGVKGGDMRPIKQPCVRGCGSV